MFHLFFKIPTLVNKTKKIRFVMYNTNIGLHYYPLGDRTDREERQQLSLQRKSLKKLAKHLQTFFHRTFLRHNYVAKYKDCEKLFNAGGERACVRIQ